METLEFHLQNLHDCLMKNPNQQETNSAPDVVAKIKEFVANVKDEEIPLCVRILFDIEKGILAFCDKCLNSKLSKDRKMVGARREVAKLIKDLLKQAKHKMNDHILPMKDFCLNLYKRDQANAVKEACFGPLFMIYSMEIEGKDAKILSKQAIPDFDFFLKELDSAKALGVKKKILKFLGFLCEKFPHEIERTSTDDSFEAANENMYNRKAEILDYYLKWLHDQSKKPDPDQAVIVGVFKGLSGYLSSFSSYYFKVLKDNEDTGVMKDVFPYLMKSLQQTQTDRYAVVNAAMALMEKHSQLFSPQLTENCEQLFSEIMFGLCTHINKKVRMLAFPALMSFLGQVSHQIMEGAIEEAVFLAMMKKITLLLDSANVHQVSFAIRSLGCFAAPLKKYMGEDGTKKFLTSLFSVINETVKKEERELEECSIQFPHYVATLSNILMALTSIDKWIIEKLKDVFMSIFYAFSKDKLFPRLRYDISFVLKLLLALDLKKNILQEVLPQFVFTGLTTTISQTFSNESETKEDETSETKSNKSEANTVFGDQKISLEKFVDFWEKLFDQRNLKFDSWGFPWSEVYFSPEMREDFYEKIYDTVLKTVLQLTDKLDVELVLKNESLGKQQVDGNDNKCEETMEKKVNFFHELDNSKPRNSLDFDLFWNLVDFTTLFLYRCKIEYFKKWAVNFMGRMSQKANQFPLISGFYKILTCSLKTCTKIQFFEEKNDKEDNNLQTFEENLLSFAKKTTNYLKEFKGDLLCSCLEFLVSFPKPFLHSILPFVEPLRMNLEIGLTYLPLAKVGLDALEFWMTFISKDEMENVVLPQILPFLNNYLLVTRETAPAKEELLKKMSGNKKYETFLEKKRKIHHYREFIAPEFEAEPYKKIQNRIVRLFGKLGDKREILLGSSTNRSSMDQMITGEIDLHSMMAWDSKKRISFVLPLKDCSLTLYFDSILPRLLELCEGSAERQIKVAACELLHALILYMIGNNSNSLIQDWRDLGKFYKRIFPVVLRLAVDIDPFVKNLFETMCRQIVHWMTKNPDSKDTYWQSNATVLLDSIVDGLCDEKSGSARVFCGDLVNEFLDWSINHNGKNSDFQNIKALFSKLQMNLHHPLASHRLGAITAYNYAKKTISETPKLVDVYILELFHQSLTSLKISSALEESENYHTSRSGDFNSSSTSRIVWNKTIEFINHLKRILRKQKETLKNHTDRIRYASLPDFMEWLFSMCGEQERVFRETCQDLFLSTIDLLDENSKAQDSETFGRKFVTERIHTAIWIQNRILKFEISHSEDHLGGEDEIQTLEYLTKFETSLSCLIWLIRNNLITPEEANNLDGDIEMEDQEKGISAKKYLDIFSLIPSFLTWLLEKQHSTSLSKSGKMISAKETKIIEDIFALFDVLLKNNPCSLKMETIASILDQKFFQILSTILISPSSLLTHTSKFEKSSRISSLAAKVIKSMLNCEQLDENSKKMVIDSLSSLINYHCGPKSVYLALHQIHLKEGQTSEIEGELFQIVEGHVILMTEGLLNEQLLGVDEKSLSTKLFELFFKWSANNGIKPTQFECAKTILKLCFRLNLDVEILLKYLSGKEFIVSQDPMDMGFDEQKEEEELIAEDNLNNIENFYLRFKEEISSFIGKNLSSDGCFKYLLQVALSNGSISSPKAFKILFEVITFCNEKRKLETNAFTRFAVEWFGKIEEHLLQKRDISLQFKQNILNLLVMGINFSQGENNLFDDQSVVKSLENIIVSMLNFEKNEQLNPETELKFAAINFLPIIFNNSRDPSKSLEAVRKIVASFPEKLERKSELSQNVFPTILKELLSVLVKTDSVSVFGELLPLFRDQENNPMYEEITFAIEEFFRNSNQSKLLEVMNMIFVSAITESDQIMNAEFRKWLVPWLGELCIQGMGEDTAVKFYCERIKQIMNILSCQKEDISIKISLVLLLEMMFFKISGDKIKKEVNDAFVLNEANPKLNLTSAILKITDSGLEDNSSLALRQISFNLRVRVFLATQKIEKNFENFFFNKDFFARKIIDLSKKHVFKVETNFEFQKSKPLDQFRLKKRIKEDRSNIVAEAARANFAGTSLEKMSALSDFFVLGSRITEKNSRDIPMAKMEIVNEENKNEIEIDEPTIGKEGALEMDELNSNICMPLFLKLLRFMYDNFLKLKIEEAGRSNKDSNHCVKIEMPNWIKSILSLFTNPQTENNIKLFITRVIRDSPLIFEHFASEFIKPMLEIIQTPSNCENGIHYLIRDIADLTSCWKIELDEPKKEAVSNFLAYLMQNAPNKKKSILRDNLEMIELFVKKFKDSGVVIKREPILALLDDKGETKIFKSTGSQLVGLLLSYGIPIVDNFDAFDISSKKKFYERLLDNINYNSTNVSKATAEIFGMLLNGLFRSGSAKIGSENEEMEIEDSGKDGGISNTMEEYKMIEELLKVEFQTLQSRKEYKKFFECLFKIGGTFMDYFLPNPVVEILNNADSNEKLLGLQIVSARADYIPNLYQYLKPMISALLLDKDEAIQTLMLEIVYKIVKTMSTTHILHFVQLMSHQIEQRYDFFINVFNDKQRALFYDISIFIFDNRPDFLSDNEQNRQMLAKGLLRGATDPADSIKKKLLQFWNQETRLPTGSASRLEQLLMCYNPFLAENWISFASDMLLELAAGTTHFENKKYLFDKDLADCEFREYNPNHLDVNSIGTHSTLGAGIPFGRTYSSTFGEPFASRSKGKTDTSFGMASRKQKAGYIQATKPADLYSLTMQSAQNEVDEKPTNNNLFQSSLLFLSHGNNNNPPFRKKQNLHNAKSSSAAGDENPDIKQTVGPSSIGNETNFVHERNIPHLQRRFFEMKESSVSSHFSRRAIQKNKQMEMLEAGRLISKGRNIEILRKYREGDIPDIQISLSEIIRPLQVLSRVDVKISHEVFVILFSAIFHHEKELFAKKRKDDDLNAEDSFTKNVKKQISQILADCGSPTKYMSTPVVRTLFDIMMENFDDLVVQNVENNTLSAKVLRSAAEKSNNLEIGALMLEKLQLKMSNKTPDNKAIIENWFELTKLLKSLEELESTMAILQNHIPISQKTISGIDEETKKGRPQEAERLYSEAISQKLKEHYTSAGAFELEFLREERMSCLRKMMAWDKLLIEIDANIVKPENPSAVDANVDKFTQMWAKSEMNEKTLALFIESSLKKQSEWGNLLNFINFSSQDSVKERKLIHQFAVELSSFYLFSGDFEQSKKYIDKAFNNAIHEWSTNTSGFSRNSRKKILQEFQLLTELEEFYSISQQDDMENRSKTAIKLIDTWKSRNLSKTIDDVNYWDDVLFARRFLVSNLVAPASNVTSNVSKFERLLTADMRNKQFSKNFANQFCLEMDISAIEAAIKQGNHDAATYFLTQADSFLKKGGEGQQKSAKAFLSLYTELLYLFAKKEKESLNSRPKCLKLESFIETSLADPKFDGMVIDEKIHMWKFLAKICKFKIEEIMRFGDSYLVSKASQAQNSLVLSQSGGSQSKFDEIARLKKKRFISLLKTSEFCEKKLDSAGQDQKQEFAHTSSKIFAKFAGYCDKLIQENAKIKIDSSNSQTIGEKILDSAELAKNSIIYSLKALRLFPCEESIQRFPKVLNILNEFCCQNRNGMDPQENEFGKIFFDDAKDIPVSLFLIWIPNMLALLTSAETSQFIAPILIQIARKYPQTLYYPFNIVKNDLRVAKTVIGEISQVLQAKKGLAQKFIDNLDFLTHPHVKFLHYLNEFITKFEKEQRETFGVSKKSATTAIENAIQSMKTQLDEILQHSSDSGKTHSEFYQKTSGWIAEKLELTPPQKVQDFINIVKDRLKKVDLEKKSLPDKEPLANLSKWMSEYVLSSEFADFIELPGQFENSSSFLAPIHQNCLKSGNEKQEENENIVKIVSFDKEISTLSSIRRPKRLKMHTSDEKDHEFLVKSGEDLRQDQRIEQIFSIMNSILSTSSKFQSGSPQRQCHLRTYKIIPMTKNLGMIEWISNTTTLRSLIASEASRRNLDVYEASTSRRGQPVDLIPFLNYVNQVFHKFVLANNPNPNLKETVKYLDLYRKINLPPQKKSTTKTASYFQFLKTQFWDKVPSDLLMVSISNMCRDYQSFFNIKQRFIRSYAVLSICSYILGIGDRHLDNFLINEVNGSVIPIDFGHAFGSATEIIPLPELIPFRFTQQIIHFCEPISSSLTDYWSKIEEIKNSGETNEEESQNKKTPNLPGSGLFIDTMTNTLDALIKKKETILNTLEVFVSEPLVDWESRAKHLWEKRKKEQEQQELDAGKELEQEPEPENGAESERKTLEKYAEEKIKLTRAKFENYNPVFVKKAEIRNNLQIRKDLYLDGIDDVIKYGTIGLTKHELEDDGNYRIRAKLPQERLNSSREHVEALIEMATDPEILGRNWVGMSVFL